MLARSLSQSATRYVGSGKGPSPGPPPYDVLFCGTDSFSVSILDAVYRRKDLWNSIHVLTTAYSRAEWGARKPRDGTASQTVTANPLEVYARSKDLPIIEIRKGQSLETDQWEVPAPFQTASPTNLLLTASFGRLIPSSMLHLFTTSSPSAALNVHPSMLPQLRGAAPIQWAIAKQMNQTGVSIQQLSDGKFDRGDIIAQETAGVPHQSTYETLLPTLSVQAAELTIQALQNLPQRHETSVPQDSNTVTWACIPKQENLTIDWSVMSAKDIEALHRAFKHTSTITTWLAPAPEQQNSLEPVQPFVRLLLRDVRLPDEAESEKYASSIEQLASAEVPSGSVYYPPGSDVLLVKTANGSILTVSQLHVESKKLLTPSEWWKGYVQRQDSKGHIRFCNTPPSDHEEQRLARNKERKAEARKTREASRAAQT
ncbi:unnamed protein product [Sympodiomycopsis kandeliae]